MRLPLLLLAVFLTTLCGFAQEPQPKLVSMPEPQYSEEALAMGLGGTVRLGMKVNKEGVGKVIFAKGPIAPCSKASDKRVARLRDAAVDAAKNAKFEPAIKDGKAIDTEILFSVKVPLPKQPEIEQGVPRIVEAGVLNGKALLLARPEYPPKARAERASGAVTVQVLISEDGSVLGAAALDGHPDLLESGADAACKSKFSPVLLHGQPIKVSGTITYHFVP